MAPRSTFLPFALPDLDEEEIEAVTAALRSGWVTTGPQVRAFEAAFAEAVGAQYAVAVNSCTAALHLALDAIGLQAGDEVITTPYTFAATAEVIRYFDARPVLVDIDPVTLNLDPSRLASAVTNRTKAIIPVHIAGLPADLDAIQQLARAHDLRVIEDAAHAFPAAYHGKPIGACSDLTCFSFYATKTITTGEGGMICTDNPAWADHCRIMALHGISRDAWKRYTAEGSWYYEIIAPGFKYNLTDIAAAMGLVQLRKAERMRQRRAAIAQRYHAAFAQRPELQLPADDPAHTHAWHLYTLRLNLEQLRVDRAGVISALKARNIGTSVHFIPLHLHPYYRDRYGYQPEDFPVAYHEFLREVSLPLYSKLTDAEVDDVIAAVLAVIEEFAQ
ncbi:MAG: DegT/DnrJ/EryC1/StrS family aminotransferase [Oscillochloridaceae bacterium umkhey_bin13]